MTGLQLFALLNLLIIGHLRQLLQYADIVGAAYGKEEITENALAMIVRGNEENPVFSEAVLWKSEGKVPVGTENTGREQIVSLYQMEGQQSAVFGRGLCVGRYFTEGETSVCLLDRETVRSLFGSDNVLGMKVRRQDTEYEVVGVLEGEQKLCVVPAKKGALYDGAAAKKAEKTASSKIAFGALEAAVGGVGQQRVDGHLYYITACLFYFFIIAIFLLFFGIKKRKRKRKVIMILCMALAIEVFVMGIGFAKPGSDYLPSYWSDFDFFVQLFKEKEAQIQELSHHQEFVSWQQMFKMWFQTVSMEMAIIFSAYGYWIHGFTSKSPVDIIKETNGVSESR